jgi:integrase/recombinase XerD
MPRKGQKLKHRKTAWPKAQGNARARDTSLDHHPLTAYMRAHFEWMLVSGYSEDTIRARRIALNRFIRWCDERGLRDPRDITAPILERYQRHLFYYRKSDGTPMTLASQLGCLAPIKLLFKWLTKEHHILYNPASELQLPRTPKHLPRVILSVQDVEAILHQADPATVQGLRDRALLETLYSTGLRRMELPALALYDVDLTRRIVVVREGKGRRDRVIPIGQRAAAWVDKYLTEARPQLLTHHSEALFVTDYGEPVTPEYLAAKVKRYMQFAGIDKPGATHLFRHACATHMLEGGADTRFIQAMLGHADLATTQIYTHVSIDKLRQIHDATHPAKLKRECSSDDALNTVDASSAPDAQLAALAAEQDDEREDGEDDADTV